MNIFYLDENPSVCASYHCDKHVVKMILESAQILCTAYHLEGDDIPLGMKPTHIYHPCTKWARECYANRLWLAQLCFWLCFEYKERYGKIHAKFLLVKYLLDKAYNQYLYNKEGFTTPPLCMPNEYKTSNTIESYRNYYRFGKTKLLKYTNREKPYWLEDTNV